MGQNTFQHTVLVNPTQKVQTCFGAAAGTGLVGNGYSMADKGKPVALALNGNYVLCTTGQEIEGFIHSVEVATYNGGYNFGGVDIDSRQLATVDASQISPLFVGTEVVAGTQVALGSKGLPVVRAGSSPVFRWSVLAIVSGTGAGGSTVLLRRKGFI